MTEEDAMRKRSQTTDRMQLVTLVLVSAVLATSAAFAMVAAGAGADEKSPGETPAIPPDVRDPCPAGPDGGGYICTPVVRAPLLATTDVGSHCDDCVTPNVPIGFSFGFYDQAFTSVQASSNGNVQFLSQDRLWVNQPLPYSGISGFPGFDYAIVPYWDDLLTTSTFRGCFVPQDAGIYRATVGTAPARIFVLEWRVGYFCFSSPNSATFQIQLEESTGDIYFVYGAQIGSPFLINGASATSGIQKGTGQAWLQHTYNQPLLIPGTAVLFTRDLNRVYRTTLAPKAAINPVDSHHCVTATVTTLAGTPVSGVTVQFQVTGSVNTAGSETTDSNGEAVFCYTGPRLPGADLITAYADRNGNGVRDVDEMQDTATKTWVLPLSTPLCEVIITNGGWIIAADGDRANFGGNAHADGEGNAQGQEEYQDQGPARDMNLHGDVLVVVCSTDNTHATVFGSATVTGYGAGTHLFRIDVVDMGEPGSNDRYGIFVANGYDSGDQQLMGGNIQIHRG